MSGGTKINTVITYGCKNFEEKSNKVASSENQEICGGVLEDLAEKARYTTDTGRTSMAFRGIHDDQQRRGVFDDEGIWCLWMNGGNQKARTVHQRKHEVGLLAPCPWLEVADLVLFEREVRKFWRFRNLDVEFTSMGRAGDHTRMQHIIDQIGYPKSSLCETHKIQAGGNPAAFPCHGVHPGCVLGRLVEDNRKM